MAQTTFGDWTYLQPDPNAYGLRAFAPVWVNSKTGEERLFQDVPDGALKAAAKGPNAVENLMWMTGGDFSRVKALNLLPGADWNQLGQMGAAHQAAADSDFEVEDIAVPTAVVVGGALGLGPALESLYGLGGAAGSELAGAAGTDALIGGAGADTLAAGGSSALTEAELAGLIESGTVGAEGAALEAGALGSAAGGASSVIPTAGGAAGGAAAAGGTALSKLSEITGIDEGTLELLGIGAGTTLGIVGADEQSDALKDIYNQSRKDRSTFLDLAKKYATDPKAYLEGPGKATMDAILRSLSVKGNPTGMPSSLDLAADASMRNWLNATNSFGNLGLGGEATQVQLQTAAAGADANKLNAIGAGLADATRAKRKYTLDDIYASLR